MRILQNIGLELSLICIVFGIWPSNVTISRAKIRKKVQNHFPLKDYSLLCVMYHFFIFAHCGHAWKQKCKHVKQKNESTKLYICKKYKNPYPISLCLVIHICFHEKKYWSLFSFSYFTGLVKNNENLTEKKRKKTKTIIEI